MVLGTAYLLLLFLENLFEFHEKVDIYEVKRFQRHLLAAIENNRLVSPIPRKNWTFTATRAAFPRN